MFRKILIANRGEIALPHRAQLLPPSAGHCHGASATPMMRRACARSANRCAWPRARDRELPAHRARGARRAPWAPTRCIPATASCRRTRPSPTRCRHAGIAFVGPHAAGAARLSATRRRPNAWRCRRPAGDPLARRRQRRPRCGHRDNGAAAGLPVLLKAAAGGGGKGTSASSRRRRAADAIAGRHARGPLGLRRPVAARRTLPAATAVTSRCRSSATARAACGTCGSASAPSSAATRRWWRRRRRCRCRRACASGCSTGPWRWAATCLPRAGHGGVPGRPATRPLPGGEPAPAGRAPGDRSRHRAGPGRSCSCAPPPASRGAGRTPLHCDGHAIELRVYAEDPAAGFVHRWAGCSAWPAADGTRVEAGVQAGSMVTPHYDPMVAAGGARPPTVPTFMARARARFAATRWWAGTTWATWRPCWPRRGDRGSARHRHHRPPAADALQPPRMARDAAARWPPPGRWRARAGTRRNNRRVERGPAFTHWRLGAAGPTRRCPSRSSSSTSGDTAACWRASPATAASWRLVHAGERCHQVLIDGEQVTIDGAACTLAIGAEANRRRRTHLDRRRPPPRP